VYEAHWQISEEFVLSGTYECITDLAEDSQFLNFMTWILGTVWEVLTLCLAVWIAVKHFRELRQHSTSGIIGDYFTVLMKTHVSYFVRWGHNLNAVLLFHSRFSCASFLAISCFQMGLLSSTLSVVCRSVTDPYVRQWFIISIEPIFPGDSDFEWSRSDISVRSIVCAGTPPDPRCSRISRWARGQLWYSNRYDFNCFSGARSCVN
jgi:hypothetical protein